MKLRSRVIPNLAIAGLVVAALACSVGQEPTPAEPAETTVARLVADFTTQTAAAASAETQAAPEATAAQATDTPVGEDAPAPTATLPPKPSDTPGPTNTPNPTGCVDDSQFVADVTVPDGTQFAPGTAFTKTWRIRNSGTCTWTGAYQFAFISGDRLGGPVSVSIAGPVAAGSEYEVSVNLTAPATPGEYLSRWQLRSGAGALFGTRPFVQIVVATTAQDRVLPAPLLFISDNDGQIWRMEADGKTLVRITSEPRPVADFDVAPTTGALAYVSNNKLIRTDAAGRNRTELVVAPPLAPNDFEGRILGELTAPRWSPDGTRIAYGLAGVNVIPAAGGQPQVIQASDAPPGAGTPPSGTIRFYAPHSWSPDGSALLMTVSFYPEAGGLQVRNLASNAAVDLTSPGGIVCCDPSWGLDGKSVYFASSTVGLISPGLWRASASTGAGVTLIPGESGGVYSLIAHPRQLQDGRLYTFMATSPKFPDGYVPLAMHRSAADGVTGRTALRTDSYVVGEVLWSADGSGAVIVDITASVADGFPFQGPLVWLPADGRAAVTFPVTGRALHWGR